MDAAWEAAVRNGDVPAMHAFLARGADVDARDRHGQTALMLAAHAGQRKTVELLIAHHANLDITAKYGLSALMLAIVAGHAEIAGILARAGTDLALCGSGAPGFAGKTASDLAAARGMDGLAKSLLPAAPSGGNEEQF